MWDRAFKGTFRESPSTADFYARRNAFSGLVAMSDITRILPQIELGDAHAAEQLLPLPYDELRRLAAVMLAGEQPVQKLQPTALVHEAWLRLVGGGNTQDFRLCSASDSPCHCAT